MKWTIILTLFLTTGSSSWQVKHPPLINLTTFTSIPEDMLGAGESFYLSAKDKKEGNVICTSNYMTALISINQRPIRLEIKDVVNFSKNKQIFTHEKYTLIIIEGPARKVGDEDYTMKGTLTLKYNSDVVWTKNIIGEGGD